MEKIRFQFEKFKAFLKAYPKQLLVLILVVFLVCLSTCNVGAAGTKSYSPQTHYLKEFAYNICFPTYFNFAQSSTSGVFEIHTTSYYYRIYVSDYTCFTVDYTSSSLIINNFGRSISAHYYGLVDNADKTGYNMTVSQEYTNYSGDFIFSLNDKPVLCFNKDILSVTPNSIPIGRSGTGWELPLKQYPYYAVIMGKGNADMVSYSGMSLSYSLLFANNVTSPLVFPMAYENDSMNYSLSKDTPTMASNREFVGRDVALDGNKKRLGEKSKNTFSSKVYGAHTWWNQNYNCYRTDVVYSDFEVLDYDSFWMHKTMDYKGSKIQEYFSKFINVDMHTYNLKVHKDYSLYDFDFVSQSNISSFFSTFKMYSDYPMVLIDKIYFSMPILNYIFISSVFAGVLYLLLRKVGK